MGELTTILADEWAGLSKEIRTPYEDKAEEENGRCETIDAAVALTQVRGAVPCRHVFDYGDTCCRITACPHFTPTALFKES